MLNELRRLIETDTKRLVDEKIRSFIQLRSKDITEIFKELCFCILAAGYSAEKSLRIQERINDGFLKLPEKELVEELRRLGHRYPETRAKYIVRARRKLDQVKNVLDTLVDCKQIREWLVENIDGLGYKEASHFLRNIGCLEVAIIDFHILNLLERYEITEKPRTLTRKKYLEIEKTLEEISRIVGLKPGELDLYLWYMETGKIVK
ncbi:MAG: N-glycosylase/DNA lyase [Nitrososphaerota archaeon]